MIQEKTIAPAPVRRTLEVKASQARAFQVFTERMGTWWPKGHSVGASPQKEVIVEPQVGGGWYETFEDGSTCQWGHVLAWEPPQRLVLAWALNAQFEYDPDLVTEVEIRFHAEAEALTRVEFEHRNLERFGDKAAYVAEQIGGPQGWPAILDLFAEAAAAA